MCRNRLSALALSAVSSFVLLAAPASGAPVSRITYDVTGGTFGGDMPNSTGPITGGTLSFTPYVPISTPGSERGHFFLSLTGPSGFMSMSGPERARIDGAGLDMLGGPGLFVNSNGSSESAAISSNLVFIAGEADIGSARATRSDLTVVTITTVSGRTTTFTYTEPILLASHDFTLGNEVRTIIPEPGTGALLGLGVLGLGAAAGGRRALRRRRER